MHAAYILKYSICAVLPYFLYYSLCPKENTHIKAQGTSTHSKHGYHFIIKFPKWSHNCLFMYLCQGWMCLMTMYIRIHLGRRLAPTLHLHLIIWRQKSLF